MERVHCLGLGFLVADMDQRRRREGAPTIRAKALDMLPLLNRLTQHSLYRRSGDGRRGVHRAAY
jgi:hypothetical protein